MSLKSLSKTRWKIESSRIVIYPYGLYYIFSAVIALLFSGILLVYTRYENTTLAESLPFVLLILFIVIAFWGYAATCIEFDNQQGRVRKLLLAFCPLQTYHMHGFQGISPVRNIGLGSYVYHLFRKTPDMEKALSYHRAILKMTTQML